MRPALAAAAALAGALAVARPAAADDECNDRTRILGLRRCPPFGEWADTGRGAFQFEWQSGIRTVPAGAATDRLYVLAWRGAHMLGRYAYAGLDYELGLALRHTPVDDDAPPEPRGMGAMQATAFLGLRADLGRLTLGAELAGGGRLLQRYYESSDPEAEGFDTRWSGAGVVEARARAGVWLAPFWQIGVMVGASPIDDLRLAVLYIGGSTRAFGR